MCGDLQLTVFPCWEEAEAALESDYDRWQAIILDAKCQYKKGDADKADRFLMNVITRIGKIAARKRSYNSLVRSFQAKVKMTFAT